MLEPPFPGLTRFRLGHLIEHSGWSIGDHTYGHPHIMEPGRGGLEIGRFTSMAAVTIILGNHDMRNVTTYPFDVLRGWWPGMDDSPCHTARPVLIGSDVWLCERTMILPGTVIGHGAVVGAGAVVSGTVPPYAIVSGNPATVRRHRFDEATIDRLLRGAWWDLPDRTINRLLPLLASHGVGALLDRIEDLRSGDPAALEEDQPAILPRPNFAR